MQAFIKKNKKREREKISLPGYLSYSCGIELFQNVVLRALLEFEPMVTVTPTIAASRYCLCN